MLVSTLCCLQTLGYAYKDAQSMLLISRGRRRKCKRYGTRTRHSQARDDNDCAFALCIAPCSYLDSDGVEYLWILHVQYEYNEQRFLLGCSD